MNKATATAARRYAKLTAEIKELQEAQALLKAQLLEAIPAGAEVAGIRHVTVVNLEPTPALIDALKLRHLFTAVSEIKIRIPKVRAMAADLLELAEPVTTGRLEVVA